MKTYINGLGCVSPQHTFDRDQFLDPPVSMVSNRMKAIDPNYKEFAPPDMVRRMGRIIKMGVAAAKNCLADAGCQIPDGIITGTGLGCIEDTEKFLTNMIRNNEEFLTPTSFIQSTHNTVSAQIALLISCHGYNFTYVHRGFSFETAILDSLMQLAGGRVKNILLGAADEQTDHSFQIQYRMGFWRARATENLRLIENPGKGSMAGEGAAFFLLENEPQERSYAILEDVGMLFQPGSLPEIGTWVRSFLATNDLTENDIDLLFLGKNGDSRFDMIYDQVMGSVFPRKAVGTFKHLCGEYMTATSFGLWLASRMLREQRIPTAIPIQGKTGTLRHILMYNHFRGINHSLILVSHV